MISLVKKILGLGILICPFYQPFALAQQKTKLQLAKMCTSKIGVRHELYNSTGIYTDAVIELRTYANGKSIPLVIPFDDKQFAGTMTLIAKGNSDGTLFCAGTAVFAGSEIETLKEDLANYRHSGCQHKKFIEAAKKTVNKWALSGSSTKTAQEINLEIASAGARTAIESVSRMNSLEPHRCRNIVDGLIKELSALPATKMSGKGKPNARSKTSHGKVS